LTFFSSNRPSSLSPETFEQSLTLFSYVSMGGWFARNVNCSTKFREGHLSRRNAATNSILPSHFVSPAISPAAGPLSPFPPQVESYADTDFPFNASPREACVKSSSPLPGPLVDVFHGRLVGQSIFFPPSPSWGHFPFLRFRDQHL